MTRKSPLVLGLCASVLLGACGGDDESSPPAAENPPAQTQPAQTAAEPTQPADGQTATTVRLDEFSIDPSDVTVEQGSELQATNVGSTGHNLTVERGTTPSEPSEELAATPTFPAGEERSLEVDVEPGRYSLVCTVPGHREAGMVGTLTVR